MTQDAKIGLFCSADALAKAVEEALSGGEVAAATRLTGFAEVLEFIEEEVPTVVLLSMADLCVEGLDAINLVDMQLGMHQHVTPVLLVEPWVAQELVSITVMTGLKVSVPSNDVHTDLVGLLHEVCPALRSPAPSAKVPLKMDDAAGEGDEPGDVIVRELDGVTSGRLEEVWLPRLLYILSVCEFTGSLTLTSSPRSLKVYLRDCRVGDLEQGDHKPLLSAFAWSKGTYRCKPGDIDSQLL